MQHTTAWSAAFAIALCLAASCSSGSGGELVSCIAPGTACCAGNACAVGLACQNAVCVIVDTDASIDGGSSDGAGDGQGDGG
jgi:hypothetical protein